MVEAERQSCGACYLSGGEFCLLQHFPFSGPVQRSCEKAIGRSFSVQRRCERRTRQEMAVVDPPLPRSSSGAPRNAPGE